MRRLLLAAAVLCASLARAVAGNDVHQSIDDFGLPIDLQQPRDDAALNDLIEPVGLSRGESVARRLYVAGIIGNSFATLGTPLGPNGNGTGDPSPSPAANQSLFTAGGAIGLAFEAVDRDWRVEFEGRSRDNLVSQRGTTFEAPIGLEDWRFTSSAKNGWSTLVNLWRDYQATDRLSLYLGGGIGGGGYRFSYLKQPAGDFLPPNYQIATTNNVSTFAWQAGGGAAYAITDRITLDIGYRYFQISNSTSTGVISYVPVPVGSEVIGSAFSASELFFAFRIYEPFRNWR